MFNRLRRWRPSEYTILLLLALGVGITTSVGVWLFEKAAELFQYFYRDQLLHQAAPALGGFIVFAIIPILALAGLIVGLLKAKFIGEERHHGVAGIMESVALAGGRLRYQRMPLKTILASFSIGAGASVGPEDPSVQIGANLGSMFGQYLRLSDERVRLLVAAGVAGGVAAAFRAPIAGVFFALEVVLGDFSTRSFGAVVLTAVTSAVMTQAIEAQSPIFTEAIIPRLGIYSYSLGGLTELPLYVLLGVLLAPVSALFIRMLYWQHDLWHHMKLPSPVKTMAAGALVGVLVLLLPQVMGTGRDTLNVLLNERSIAFTINILLALAIAKMVATTISLGGGFVGGMFAPSLFVGAALGRAFGEIAVRVFPDVFAADPAAFAIVGMAATMTGVIRAPITAVILLFELTDDYRLILPILLTSVVCLVIVEKIAPQGLYHLGLARKGIRLVRGRDIDLMQTITVSEAMEHHVNIVPASLPFAQLEAEFDRLNTHGLVVTDDEGLLYGIVTLQDLARASENGATNTTAGELCTRSVISVTPNTPISEALRLIGTRDLGRLPVVERDNPRKVVGLLRRRDIVRAYELATQRKVEAATTESQVQLEAYSRAHVFELRVEAGSAVDKQIIRDVHWPAGSIIATVRRGRQVFVPQGNMQLHAGDLLTVVTADAQPADLLTLVRKPKCGQNV